MNYMFFEDVEEVWKGFFRWSPWYDSIYHFSDPRLIVFHRILV